MDLEQFAFNHLVAEKEAEGKTRSDALDYGRHCRARLLRKDGPLWFLKWPFVKLLEDHLKKIHGSTCLQLDALEPPLAPLLGLRAAPEK